ncbi:uncharacterized protein LOC117901780 [Drosophila subobscura]|uniref:uncharacterized protein LOC117901780 n=1 Tax=Drosophila subobscura TaxID=7241 RepID=UPI00155A0F39|nr:uncharacterized protein LOC117901780 [Drosophila subobscura]
MVFGVEFGAIVGCVLISCVIILFYIYAHVYKSWSQINTLYEAPVLPPLHSLKLTLGQLKRYNGTRQDGRILVAFKGKIYDVSADSEFIAGGSLNFVAGTDFSRYLNTELPLEPLERAAFVERWQNQLDTIYDCVGSLVDRQGNPLFMRKEINWQNSEALEDIMQDQKIFDFCQDKMDTKSVEVGMKDSVKNSLSNEQFLKEFLNAETAAPVMSLNNAPNQIIDLDLD